LGLIKITKMLAWVVHLTQTQNLSREEEVALVMTKSNIQNALFDENKFDCSFQQSDV